MILVANTAEELLKLVLAHDGRILEVFERRCAGQMNEIMAPAVEELLARHPGKLTRLACVRGPGSFTGVRLGLALLTGLAMARGIPMAGIDYLPVLAASAPDASATEIHVLTHSRRDKVYHQAFRPAPAQARKPGDAAADDRDESAAPAALPAIPDFLGPPLDLEAPKARAIIAERASCSQVALCGSGLRRNHDTFAKIPGAILLTVEDPTPEALLAAALAANYDGPPVEALYLRGSDAQENLAEIAAKRGLTEEEAQRRLDEAMKS